MPKDRFDRLPEEKRLRLLDAAIWEFAEHGYHGTSMRQIAARAGIAKGLTYYYFENKEDLFVHLVHHVGATWVREFERFFAGASPTDVREYFRQLIRFMMEFIDTRPHMYHLYVKHIHERDLPFLGEIVEQARALDERLFACLRAEQAAGTLRADVDVAQAHFLLDAMGIRLYEVFFSPGLDALDLHDASREERLRVVDGLLDLAWRGIKA
jgi:AcrR family transcriptional regulator